MKYLLSFLFSIFILACSDNTSNSRLLQTEPFNIKFSSSLAPGATLNVPVNARLILESTEALDPKSITNNTVYIEDQNQNRHQTEVTLVDRNIIIKPIVYFKASTQYNIVITTQVTDEDGNGLSQPTIIPFVSGAVIDNIGPTLIATLPLDDNASYNVEPYAVLYFQFNETVAPFIPNASTLRVYTGSNPDINGTFTLSGALLSFKPSINLSESLLYYAELNTTHIKDLSGNSYDGNSIEKISFNVKQVGITPLVSLTESAQPFSTNTSINTIITDGSKLFVGTSQGLEVLDYNLSTTQFSSLAHLTLPNSAAIYNLEINTTLNQLYVASSEGFSIIDISNETAPLRISHYTVVDANNHDLHTPVYGLNVIENRAYLAATLVGIVGLDISNLTTPQELFRQKTSGVSFDITKIGTELFVSDYNASTKRFDLSGTLLGQDSATNVGLDHTIMSHSNSFYPAEPLVASGTLGFKYRDTGAPYLSMTTASYLSKIVLGPLNNSNNNDYEIYGIVKQLGLVNFKQNGSTNISFQLLSYIPLSYEATALGYVDYPTGGLIKGIIYVADDKGLIHALEKN